MAIIDVITYNGEEDILELRLNILDSRVDQFIICEARHTFTGFEKPLFFEKQKGRFNKWVGKIKYHVIDENYSFDERKLAEESPNTIGAAHWKEEFLQKESIKKALIHLQDDDVVFIGDVDEVWQMPRVWVDITKLKLRVYAYYLDNLSSEDFWGTIVTRYGTIKNKCLNHLRTNPAFKTGDYYGWHFTSMGGVKEVQRKINASYTTESYNTYELQKNLSKRVHDGVDIYGRPFSFKIDESDWPRYLKDSRTKYAHLCRGHVKPTINRNAYRRMLYQDKVVDTNNVGDEILPTQ